MRAQEYLVEQVSSLSSLPKVSEQDVTFHVTSSSEFVNDQSIRVSLHNDVPNCSPKASHEGSDVGFGTLDLLISSSESVGEL